MIEKIRQEIEKLRKLLEDHNYYLDNSEQALGYGMALDDIGQFLDTLSEEPDKSLEEEIDRFEDWMETYNQADYPTSFTTRDIARHFAEWQESQMPMPEDTVLFNKGVEEGKRLMMENAVEGEVIVPIYEGDDTWSAEIKIPGRYEIDDKVRIIIIKED